MVPASRCDEPTDVPTGGVALGKAQPSPTEDAPWVLSTLLAASEEGDREWAWARFLESYSGLLLRAACMNGTGYDDAMDGYAFVLDQLRASDFRRLRRFQAIGSARFTNWLVLVARRLCLDQRRHRYGRRRKTQGAATDARAMRRRLADLVGEQVDVAELRDNVSPVPDAVLAARERRRTIDSVLARLDSRALLLLRLRFGKGLTAREIADLMGYPSQFHVFRHLKAVLAEVRQTLVEAGVDGPGL
jgi:RNA polymerase sigma factor (sigma-70 family)